MRAGSAQRSGGPALLAVAAGLGSLFLFRKLHPQSGSVSRDLSSRAEARRKQGPERLGGTRVPKWRNRGKTATRLLAISISCGSAPTILEGKIGRRRTGGRALRLIDGFRMGVAVFAGGRRLRGASRAGAEPKAAFDTRARFPPLGRHYGL